MIGRLLKGAFNNRTAGSFPDSVVAIAGKGRIARRDYRDVLIPAAQVVLSRDDNVRCNYELGPDVTGYDAGAIWEGA